MNVLKLLYHKIINYNKPKIETPFFTKDIFKDRKYIIGDYTYGNPKIFYENENSNLIIGKFCSIANDVTIILGGNHRTDWITTYPFNVLTEYFPNALDIIGHPVTKGDVVIGNDVWIGMKSTILSGVTIGDGAVIAAGSVVTKNVGCYEIWGGNPARLLKKRFTEDEIEKLLEMKWWEWNIEKINDEVHYLCSNKI